MKYFTINKEELRGSVMTGEIYPDGEYINEADELEIRTITIGYVVSEYDEQRMLQGVKPYPVATDTEDWSDNADEVLENIKRDYPADEWQNMNW